MYAEAGLISTPVSRVTNLMSQHPLLTVFAIAMAVRLISGVILYLLVPEGWLALDDNTYVTLAAQRVEGDTAGWSEYLHALYSSTSTFLVPLGVLYWAFGTLEVVGPLFVMLIGAGVATMTAKLALEVLDHRWAISAGLVVALLPSQIGWSITTLKDAAVWLVAAALAWVFARTARRTVGKSWRAWAGVAGLLFALSHLRPHSTVVAGIALVVATGMLWWRHSWHPIVLALVLATAIPWLAGGGPAGIDIITSRATDLSEVRAANAEGASSAFVPTAGPTAASDVDPLEAVRTGSDLEHLPRGLSVMLLEPYPWAENRTSQIIFAKLDTLLWYPLLGLAAVSVTRIRRHPELLLFPFLYGGGMVLVYALAEGNLGSAFRHRGEFVWVVALFATFGAERLWGRRVASESASDAEAAA